MIEEQDSVIEERKTSDRANTDLRYDISEEPQRQREREPKPSLLWQAWTADKFYFKIQKWQMKWPYGQAQYK